MKKIIPLVISILLITMLYGCAIGIPNSKIFKDPEFNGKRFSRICILANVPELDWRNFIEYYLVEELNKYGVYAESGSSIFFPTRNYTLEDIKDSLQKRNFDAYLEVINNCENSEEWRLVTIRLNDVHSLKTGWIATTISQTGDYYSKGLAEEIVLSLNSDSLLCYYKK